MRLFGLAVIVFVLCAHEAMVTKRQIPIGGFFHNDNKDAEIAFRYALKRESMYNPHLEFVPRVQIIDPTDSYQAENLACGFASEGVAAIFGPSSRYTSGIVASVCNKLGIPHILAHWQPDEMYPAPAADDDDDDNDDDDYKNNNHNGDGDYNDYGDYNRYDRNRGDRQQRRKPIANHSYTRNFFPHGAKFSEVLGKFIADSNWNGFTLVYETADSLERLQDVLQLHAPGDHAVTVRQLPAGRADETDYMTLLKEIEVSGESFIMVDAEPAKVLRLLQQAESVKLMKEYENYIITSLDAHALDFGDLHATRANITMLRMMNPDSEEMMSAVHSWRQQESRLSTAVHSDRVCTEAALFDDAVRHFAGALREYAAQTQREVQSRPMRCEGSGGGSGSRRWEQGREILKVMNNRSGEGITGRVVFDDSGRREDFYMEMLKMNKEGFQKIATWQTDEIKHAQRKDELDKQINESMLNKTFIVATRMSPPWLMYKNPLDGLQGNNRFEGYTKDLLEMIAQDRHFTFRIDPILDNSFGTYDKKTKKWSAGIIKELLERRADMAVCDLTITYERRRAVDFTMPFMSLGIGILFAKPRKEPPVLFSFMNPLSVQVWMYMLTTYLCVSMVLFFAARIAADDWENPHPCNDDPEELENLWNMHNCVWLTVGSIMQQGCDLLPKAVSTRLVVSFWWFFALILTSSYTANLAAFLTKEKMDASINSAEDLTKQTIIKYGAMKGGSTMSFFKDSNYSTYQKMWAVMEASPGVLVKDNDEGIERVEKGNHKFAFLCESSTIQYKVERNCNLTQIGALLDSKGYGIAMPVNSPYRTLIAQSVLKLSENSKLQVLKDKWWKVKDGGCQSVEDKGGSPELGMINVGGVFLVLCVGCAVGLLIGVLEFLWNVREVAIQNKITPFEALKIELLFALDVRKTTKPVHLDASGSSASASRRSNSLQSDDDHSSLSTQSCAHQRQNSGKAVVNNRSGTRGGSARHLNSI